MQENRVMNFYVYICLICFRPSPGTFFISTLFHFWIKLTLVTDIRSRSRFQCLLNCCFKC